MSKLIEFFVKHWISIPLCLVILYLCFMNTESLPSVGVVNFDKFVHFLMFLTVSGVIFFENTSYLRNKTSLRTIIIFSFIFPTVYSGLIEIGQEYLAPTRAGDWMDFLFDGIGAFLGLIICLLINKRLTPKSPKGDLESKRP